MEEKKSVDMGKYQLDTTEKWSPYRPFTFKAEKEVLTLKAPKYDNFRSWYQTKILGYPGLEMSKYMKQDPELLKDTLEDLLIEKDAFTYLNWLYRITRFIGDTSKEFVVQMPEDFIKAFLISDSQHDRLINEGCIWVGAQADISPIHYNAHIPEEPSKEAYQSYPICSLKLLALWILKILEMVHKKYESEEEFEFTFNEVCQAYITYQDTYWWHRRGTVEVNSIVALDQAVGDQGVHLFDIDGEYNFVRYLSTGLRCDLISKYVRVDSLVETLKDIYNRDYRCEEDI